MIRLNIVALLILAAIGWAIDGFVEAATPMTPQRNMEAANELLRIVKPGLVQELTLEPRKPASKPSVIYWPENVTETEDVRLIVNFNDEYQVRLDSTGQVFSNSGRNIESLAIILDGLNVSLKPVFDVPEEQINTLLRRAEQTSGKVQPDLAGNYFVIGSPMDLEQAGMVLLHDPRVETAVFDKTEDPRKAVAMQKQARLGANPAISSSLANNQTVFTDSWLPNAPESTNFGSIQEETYDIQGQLVSRKSKRVGTDNDWENRDGLPATLGACCVSLDNYDQNLWPGPMLGGPSPTLDNPQVISFCRPNLNSQDCVELYEGVFLKLGVCDAINVNAAANRLMANCQNEVDVAGSCCIAGDVEVLTSAECIDGDGLFMHTYFSRFDALNYGNFPNVNVNSTPPFNQQLNTQLLAHAYGLTNFIWENVGGPFGPTSPPGSVFNSNYSYWGLFGMGPASPFGFGGGIVPFESSNGDFNNTSNNYNINITSGGLAGFWAGNPGSYRMGLIDFQTHDAAGNPTGVVATTTPGGNVVTGGFTFGTSSNATGVIYNPNIILATANDSLCEFGICAVDCWDGPGSANPNAEFCETASASSRDLQALTPILGPEIIAPTGVIQTFFGPQEVGNVRCSSWVYELSCNQMAGRSTFDSYNPTGSLWQNILGPTGVPNDPTTWRPEPENPILAGCQTPNPDPDDPELTWWKDYQSGADNLCCFGDNSVPYTTAPCEYEEFVVEEEANALRGDCFFSNANYPTMFVNQGGEQILGLLGCYGDGVCAIYCNDQVTSDDICALAPICCDEVRCDDQYASVSGWSFICADLVNQRTPFAPFYIPGLDIDLTGQVMTDFDQNIRLGGPYPEFNPLNLVTPVLRNADGSVQDQNPATPVIEPRVLPSPNSCRIAYGVQNQCYTPYFSEYQPSLGLAAKGVLPAIGAFTPLNMGCSDFECCHRVCSIDPAQTNYDYGTCCTVAWTEECVDKAQEICYTNQGGVVSTVTPDFSPLQNHLSQKTGRGPRPLSTLQYQNGMRRLAPAPQQAPSVISPTTLPTQPADNWLQSLYSVQWVSNPLGSALTTLALPSVNGPVGRPGIAGGLQWQADPITGEFTPLIQQINDPNNWNDFYYGEVPSRPIPWWGGEGLSLYGNIPGQGWPQDPSYLTYSLGLYSWGQYIAQQRPGFHPWGPYVNGTAGAGLNIAVLDTSAWLQEYINDAGILVGAVHEDLGNILLEGPVIGAAPVQMMFDPFVNQPQRGTAVLGTIAAAVDGVGTDGIAPNALTFFYPTQSVAEGNREELAWFAALVRLKAGDVLVATYPGGSPGTGSTDCILIDRGATLNSFDILEIAENLAVTVVFPLGDNGLDISAALPTLERPNMLFAGASMPSILPRKFWSSNYVGVDGGGGDNVMCSMVPIVTTGGDCNLTRMSIATATDPPNQPSGYISHEMRQRSYTNNFGNTFDGSKAAAAQVAGVAACLQGLSLQFYGAPQPPDDLINILYTSRRIGGGLTAPPNPAWLPADSFGINGDALTGWLYPSDDTVGAPDIGGFTDPAAAGVELVMNPAYEAHPNVQTSMQAMFIRGYYLTGNGMALNNRNDWDYFAGLSEFTFPGEGPNVGEQDDLVPGPLPPTRGGFFGDGIEYPGGEVTDLFVTGLETNKNFINSNGTLALDVQFRITPDTVYESIKEDLDAPAGSVLELTAGFVYSFETETWQEMSYAVSTTDDLNQMINLTYKSPPVDRSLYFGKGGEYYVRSVLYTPSDFGGPGDPFVIYYDFLSLRGDGTTPGPP